METITKSDLREIIEKITALQEDISYIKCNMVDGDCILTEEDKISIEEAERDLKEGKTISLENFEKELENVSN